MKILSTEKYHTNFGILTKPPKKTVYAPNCWNSITSGKYKGYDFKIFDNYVYGEHSSTLIAANKGSKWILSKLKYKLFGNKKILWSYAKDD